MLPNLRSSRYVQGLLHYKNFSTRLVTGLKTTGLLFCTIAKFLFVTVPVEPIIILFSSQQMATSKRCKKHWLNQWKVPQNTGFCIKEVTRARRQGKERERETLFLPLFFSSLSSMPGSEFSEGPRQWSHFLCVSMAPTSLALSKHHM